MYFPPLLGRQDGFHQPGALRQSLPGEPRDSGHSTFLALRIRCPSDDISTALCRRERGSLPASKPQPVEKPITGKASCELQFAPRPRHVWSADLFLSGGQKWGKLLLSKGQRGDGRQIALSLVCHCTRRRDVEIRLAEGWESVWRGGSEQLRFVLEKDALACAKC